MLHVLEPLCEEVWSPRIHNTSATDGMSRLMLESARAADDDIIEFKCRVECMKNTTLITTSH